MRNGIVPDHVARDTGFLAFGCDLEAIDDERLFMRSRCVVDGEQGSDLRCDQQANRDDGGNERDRRNTRDSRTARGIQSICRILFQDTRRVISLTCDLNYAIVSISFSERSDE